MSEIIYPQIPHDEWKSVKLKIHDIEAIHHLYHLEKWTIPQIADRFKVINSTIRYHLDPEYRQKQIDVSGECAMKKYWTDENFKLKAYKRVRIWKTYQRKNNENYRNWADLVIKEYRKNNKNKISIQKKEYYQTNEDKIKEYQKEYQKEYKQNNKDKLKEYQKKHYLNKKKVKRHIQYAMRWF